ncbi:DUF1013 domain-containing protein [Roseospira goensis]|uniref:DUF1013 domain-containing protein n=1 Tax=Roseospira goensis TaxID=391922 RepID=A0A7W6WK80_9PROT|nr:DUF1013 domain-containing protein [Roseospira goensis]MBB4285494.1 hypothetical protein [Roseospira goensis]
MALPLMPKATAVWLVENTALTFEQIADFCGMHELEIQAIADGEVAVGITGLDPLANGQLTQSELDRCQADPDARLVLQKGENPIPQSRQKGARYTPVSKRHDRPDGIAWLLKNHPELSDAQVCKLLGTTKPTIQAIRDRSHWNAPNIKARNPVILGLCTEADLEKAIIIARGRARHAERQGEPEPAADAPEGPDADPPPADDDPLAPAVPDDDHDQ